MGAPSSHWNLYSAACYGGTGRALNSVVRQQLNAPSAFETKRLTLRRATDADIPAIFEYASDPEVTIYLVWKRVSEEDAVRDYLVKSHNNWANGSEYTWFIAERDDDRVIGAIGARLRGAEAEIGFVLNRKYWGRGYMTESASAVINWLQRLPTVARISATCDVENYRSARVLEKLGLAREGLTPRGIVRPNISNEPRATCVYARTTAV